MVPQVMIITATWQTEGALNQGPESPSPGLSSFTSDCALLKLSLTWTSVSSPGTQ